MSISTDYTYFTFQVKHGMLTSDRVQVRAMTVEDAETILRDVRIDGERIDRWKLEHTASELK